MVCTNCDFACWNSIKKPSGISEPELLINQFCRCSGAFYYLCDIYLYNYFLNDVYWIGIYTKDETIWNLKPHHYFWGLPEVLYELCHICNSWNLVFFFQENNVQLFILSQLPTGYLLYVVIFCAFKIGYCFLPFKCNKSSGFLPYIHQVYQPQRSKQNGLLK